MCVVWSAFFLWGVLMTEYTLSALDAVAVFVTPGTWQYDIKHKLEAGMALYLPAIVLLLASLLLFFYRVPRVRGRLTIPLEFAVTTLLFITIQWTILYGLYRVALLVQGAGAQASAPSPAFALGAAITIAMLAMLFWLQGAGSLRRCWRRLQRPQPAPRQVSRPAPARSAHLVQ
jgi:hypothetical protein